MMIFGFLLTGCQQDDSIEPVVDQSNQTSAKILTEGEIQKEIIPIIQNFLNAQYDYIIGTDNNIPKWNILSGSDTLQKELNTYKDFLKNGHSNITRYKSKIEWKVGEILPGRIGSFNQSGNTITIYNAIDYYTINYHYNENGSIDNTESIGGVPYDEIKLQFINGGWWLESWGEKGALGISPRWYVYPTQQTESVVNINTNIYSKILTTYSRSAAKNYAHTYVYNPNTNYTNYTNSGGDCTNFVSQCLKAGGWTTNGSWSTSTQSWRVADKLKDYLLSSGRIVPASYPLSSLEVGDIVQEIESTGRAYHSMIVTKKTITTSSNRTFVTYRNAAGYANGKDIEITNMNQSKLRRWKIANSYWSLA